MTEIALGAQVFKRTDKLAELLESAEGTCIEKVYIADNGSEEDKRNRQPIYDRDWEFPLEVIDMDYDVGLGAGKRALAEASSSEYLIITDNDNEIPDNVEILIDQLKERPDVGGVSGMLLERGMLTGMCHDFRTESNLLIRDTPDEKEVQTVAGEPFVEFEFLPNVIAFRRECLEDYSWDPECHFREHLDFYVAHHESTDWKFGVCPKVLFPHKPGGDATYSFFRTNLEKKMEIVQYILDKWGYRQIYMEDAWLDKAHGNPPIVYLARYVPAPIRGPYIDANQAFQRVKNRVWGLLQ